MLPFLALAGLTGAPPGQLTERKDKAAAAATAEEVAAKAPPKEEPIHTALQIDQLRLELGYGLLGLINNLQGARLTDQMRALRRQLAAEMGFVMPSVRILDNLQLAANTYVIRVKEIEAGRGELRPDMLLVMDPRGGAIALPGETTAEPTFGLPAHWVAEASREEATFRGYTVVEPQTVLTTHLTEILKDNMAELLSYAETQKLLDELDKSHQKLVDDLVPSQISVGGIQRVLQNLLAERVSIRDLPTILEGIAEACGYSRNISVVTEHVRARLARQICEANTDDARLHPARHPVAGMGAGLRRGAHRPGRGAPAQHGAVPAAGIHRRGAPDLRAPRHARRDAGAADQRRRPTLCALDHRALPADHRGDVAERSPSQGAHQDGRHDLTMVEQR